MSQLRPLIWLAMIPLFLVIAGLTIPQINDSPISIDEHTSLWNAGGAPDGPYSPIEIIQSIYNYSAQHTPGFFLTLGLWGNLTGWNPPILRVLAILFTLLAMAWTYRLGRDMDSPQVGLVAVILLSSSAFYAMYLVHIRMYPFFMTAVAFELWIYLRILRKKSQASRLEYLGLFGGTLFLLSAHVFSVMLLIAMGLYHLLIVRKDRRWMKSSLAVGLAVLLFSPYGLVLLHGYSHTQTVISVTQEAMSTPELLATVLYLFSNGTFLILVIAVVLAIVAFRRGKTQIFPLLWAVGVTLLIITVINAILTLVPPDRSRYLLVMWVPVCIVMAVGMMQVARWKFIPAVTIGLWVLSGLWMHTTIDYERFTGGRVEMALAPSVHWIAEELDNIVTPNDKILGYTNTLHLIAEGRHGPSVASYYFTRRDMSAKFIYLDRDRLSIDDARTQTLNAIAGQPSIWFTYQPDLPKAEYLQVAQEALLENHELCETRTIRESVILEHYVWRGLACQLAESPVLIDFPDISIRNLDIRLSEDESALSIVGQWQVAQNFPELTYNVSYQIITPDWQNVAQKDEFVLTDRERWIQVTMPVDELEAGDYRLMIVIYRVADGEKLTGTNQATGETGTLLAVTSFKISR